MDLTKTELKEFYTAIAKPKVVDVPAQNYIVIDGKGDPNKSEEFQTAIEALYPVAYAIKFLVKKGETTAEAVDFKVMPLEGLWWVPEMEAFSVEHKDDWLWSIMIAQPEFVNKGIVDRAIEQVKAKKSLPAVDAIRFESHHDGLAAQILHKGPYSEEGPTIHTLHEYIKNHDYNFRGKHREIYLSDMRRTKPENLRTIIRQPVTKK